jgi:hypothetical protein
LLIAPFALFLQEQQLKSAMTLSAPEHIGEKIPISQGYIFRNEFDIIECVPDRDAELTADRLRVAMDAIEKMAAGRKECIMIVTNPTNTMTREARNMPITDRKLKYTLAQAMVVNSIATLMLANFYVKFKNFPFPYRVFKNREKAIAWLKQKRLELDPH